MVVSDMRSELIANVDVRYTPVFKQIVSNIVYGTHCYIAPMRNIWHMCSNDTTELTIAAQLAMRSRRDAEIWATERIAAKQEKDSLEALWREYEAE